MRVLLLVLLVAAVASCSVRQEVNVQPDGSGTVAVQVDLQPAFADWVQSTMEDARTLGLKKGSGGIFDEAAIRRSVASFPGVTLTRLSIPSREHLEMTLALSDITALAGSTPADPGRPPLVSLERSGTRRTLRVYLDAANYQKIKPLIPGADNQILDVLGPQVKDPYTDAEYDDVLKFTVGDDAPKWVAASRVEVSVRVPGRIISHEGGSAEGSTVRYDIPLRDMLLLRPPLVYAIEYDQGK